MHHRSCQATGALNFFNAKMLFFVSIIMFVREQGCSKGLQVYVLEERRWWLQTKKLEKQK
jgi:hypothetical protein